MVSGVVIDCFDVAAFADAINQLLNDTRRIKRMEQDAVNYVSTRFCNHIITKQYLTEYERATGAVKKLSA